MKSLYPFPDTFPRHESIVEWIMKSSETDAPALVFGSVSLSYVELHEKSNQVAHYLRGRGVKPGDHVGLCFDRSVELVVVLIGILKAGAAYVPLDPAYPSDRLAMMIEDAGLKLLLCHAAYNTLFPHALIWEDVSGEMDECSDASPDAVIGGEDPAYIIFTSGSTGRPKGIAMPHRALANLVEWQIERSSFRPGARVLQYSSISFDVSFQEIVTTLASGGTLFLISDAERKDPRKLLAQLSEQGIERLFLPYIAMRSMIDAAHVTGVYPVALKEIITAGEQLRVDDAVRLFFTKIGGAILDNQYGPSETHVITAQLLEGDPAEWPDLPSIGTPLKNCGTVILDESMQPVCQGEQGELYLAGRNLALGYIGRPELTEQVFIPNPFKIPERPLLYKTGDLASYNADGSINFLGRSDHQIKIRGHRIEPGEINNTLSAFPGVEQSLTHAFAGVDGILQLATYYTLRDEASVDHEVLREYLMQKLPEYMVPAFLIALKKLPYTPSGKVDLKALPKPSIENSRFATEHSHYESGTEEALAKVWGELLGLEGIPRNADFFELGGDSLRAVTLVLRIQQLFGKDLPLAALANASTIMELAKLIQEQHCGIALSGCRSLKLIQQGEPGQVPLFLVHGGQGNVLVFHKFQKSLDARQPVYAFQWSGWDGYRGHTEIHQMARAYMNELMLFYPEGPFRLGGYCIGALIAIELARLLEQEGREVLYPMLVWDAPNIESIHYRRDEPWDSAQTIQDFDSMKRQLEAIRVETEGEYDVPHSIFEAPSGKSALIRRVPGLLQILRKSKECRLKMREFPQRIVVAMYLLLGKPVPVELRADYCLHTMVRAVHRHRSSRCSGDILYFRSDCVVARFFGLPGWWDDPFLGFAELCEGRFEAYAVGGGHTDVLDIPEMSDIVKSVFESGELT